MTPATLRSIWFSITTATEDGMPIPIGTNLDDSGAHLIAGLSFPTAADALAWAVWVDREHTSHWTHQGTVTFIGHQSGWTWLLSCHKPSERSGSSSSRVIDGSERLLVPCGRCGHGENRHQHAPGHATACLDCPGAFCQPVLVRVGGAATTTIVDAEDEVE